jgi:hypothetical protein
MKNDSQSTKGLGVQEGDPQANNDQFALFIRLFFLHLLYCILCAMIHHSSYSFIAHMRPDVSPCSYSSMELRLASTTPQRSKQ